NVFAYEESKGSVGNFSDWSVEESRIEQPDGSYARMEIKFVRKVKHRQTERTKQERNKLIGKIFLNMNGGQDATTASFGNSFRDCARYHSRKDIDTEGAAGTLASSFSARKVTDTTQGFSLEVVRKRPQDSAGHHALVHPISSSVSCDGGVPSGSHLYPHAGHLLELHQSNKLIRIEFNRIVGDFTSEEADTSNVSDYTVAEETKYSEDAFYTDSTTDSCYLTLRKTCDKKTLQRTAAGPVYLFTVDRNSQASSVIYMTNSLSPDYTIRGLINMDSIGGGREQKEGARQGKMRAPLRWRAEVSKTTVPLGGGGGGGGGVGGGALSRSEIEWIYKDSVRNVIISIVCLTREPSRRHSQTAHVEGLARRGLPSTKLRITDPLTHWSRFFYIQTLTTGRKAGVYGQAHENLLDVSHGWTGLVGGEVYLRPSGEKNGRNQAVVLVTRLCRHVCCRLKRCVGLCLGKQVSAIRWIDCGWRKAQKEKKKKKKKEKKSPEEGKTERMRGAANLSAVFRDAAYKSSWPNTATVPTESPSNPIDPTDRNKQRKATVAKGQFKYQKDFPNFVKRNKVAHCNTQKRTEKVGFMRVQDAIGRNARKKGRKDESMFHTPSPATAGSSVAGLWRRGDGGVVMVAMRHVTNIETQKEKDQKDYRSLALRKKEIDLIGSSVLRSVGFLVLGGDDDDGNDGRGIMLDWSKSNCSFCMQVKGEKLYEYIDHFLGLLLFVVFQPTLRFRVSRKNTSKNDLLSAV
ncbi:hypothetical protein WN51_13901, partial [Melipona quadrifasciata]